MLGEELKAAVESFRFPDLTAEVTVEADEPIDGDRRIRKRCGSSADVSMVVTVAKLERKTEIRAKIANAQRRKATGQPSTLGPGEQDEECDICCGTERIDAVIVGRLDDIVQSKPALDIDEQKIRSGKAAQIINRSHCTLNVSLDISKFILRNRAPTLHLYYAAEFGCRTGARLITLRQRRSYPSSVLAQSGRSETSRVYKLGEAVNIDKAARYMDWTPVQMKHSNSLARSGAPQRD
ncbi:hypothetical protein PHSY_002248 [Pseudozyma hubeiensis SY62]|uniref:Uncharacterized protein n=1 Tax=Pseudozyma hubeiensis (strain SY62) TaxID=1305764 RepID=R9P9A2_PSEHS|nr:hypothetical protein PHSY_002248 [Pseudozyma hubeiensis SY62]GAC94675.1 hypothetical protein PHSY_002248 [Pseudozyma hubeiensis SY62]